MTASSIRDKKSLCLSVIAFLFLAALLAVLIFPQTARADDARVYVDPASDGASVGSTYTVYIKVDNVTDLYGWSCTVDFEPNILQVEGSEGAWQITEGSFLKSGGASTWFNTDPTVNNTTGNIQGLMCTRLGSPSGVTGAGTLFSITFRVIGNGDSPINIYPQLSNSYAQTIPCTVESGTFKKVTTYYFTLYDQASPGMQNWILVSNPDFNVGPASVEIWVGNNKKWSGAISSGDKVTPQFPATIGGPVKIVCTNGLPLVVSSRVTYNGNFNEIFATTQEAINTEVNSEGDTTYYFTWYDQASPGMQNWILVSNPDFNVGPASVEIYVGNTRKWAGIIPSGDKITPQFPVTIGGPVKIVCTNGLNLVVSSRVLCNGSFNEIFATTQEGITTKADPKTYYFTWYDQASPGMQNWILVSNPDFNVGPASVEIYVGNTRKWAGIIPSGDKITPQFPVTIGGPVKIVCTNGLNLVVSSRVLCNGSFNEIFATTQEKL